MRKYLAYYETEWPANIAELTAVENKPFVGYLKGEGVSYTVIPEPVVGPADNEIWYTTTTGEKINPINGATNSINSFTSHIYENNLGKLIYNENVTYISPGGFQGQHDLTTCYLPSSITEIYDYVFYDCPLLDKVYYNGTVEMWNNIEFNAIAVGLSNSITVYCIDGKITIQPVN